MAPRTRKTAQTDPEEIGVTEETPTPKTRKPRTVSPLTQAVKTYENALAKIAALDVKLAKYDALNAERTALVQDAEAAKEYLSTVI